jgi:hypothetical protein
LLGLLLGLVPAIAHAQIDIDQGKSAEQMFSSDCATCHKSARGLADGRGSGALRSFLEEHYTSNSAQAAALSAYVLGAGGNSGPPPAVHQPKATAERAKPAEHPKLSDRSQPAVEAVKRPNNRERPKAKPEETAPATAKLQPPTGENVAPAGEAPPPAIAIREHRKKQPETVPPPPPPAAVVAEPAAPEAPAPEASPEANPAANTTAPAHADSDEGGAAPHDNIPD